MRFRHLQENNYGLNLAAGSTELLTTFKIILMGVKVYAKTTTVLHMNWNMHIIDFI